MNTWNRSFWRGAAAILCAGAICIAQTVADSQKLAAAKYPELSKLGSPLNLEFLKRYNAYRRTNPGYFTDPQWPVKLAEECEPTIKAAEDKEKAIADKIEKGRQARLLAKQQASAEDEERKSAAAKYAKAESHLVNADLRVIQIVDGGWLGQGSIALPGGLPAETDTIFIYGALAGKADGDRFQGPLYYVGVTSYDTVLGAQKTVHSFARSPEEAIQYHEASK